MIEQGELRHMITELREKVDLRKRAKEGVVVARGAQMVDSAAAAGTKLKHAGEEQYAKAGDSLGVAGLHIDKVKERGSALVEGVKQSAQKNLDPSVLKGKLESRATKIGVAIIEGWRQIVNRNAVKVKTIYEDRIKPAIDLINNFRGQEESSDDGPEIEVINVVDTSERSQRHAKSTIEGSALIDLVAGALSAAVDFDSLKADQVPALIERAFASTELARKVTPAIMDAFSAIILEASSFGFKTGKAKESLGKILGDPDVLAEMEGQQINPLELLKELNEALKKITEIKDKVMESRGENRSLSWQYEKSLVKASEASQAEAFDAGWEVLDALPDTADQLTMGMVINARVKALDLSGKSAKVIGSLTSIARSMERRFPGRVEEIRFSLQGVVAPWKEAKGIIRGVSESTELNPAITRQASGDIFRGLIEPNEPFMALTKEQQASVMEGIGGTITEETKRQKVYDKYEVTKGSLYEGILQAYGEYARLLVAYESSREYVNDHPESADQLMVLAERIMQAKSVMELMKSKMDAKIIIETRKIDNEKRATALEATNTAEENAALRERTAYYAKMLEQYNERVQREAPTVKKIIKYLGIAGLTTVSLVGVVEVAPAAIEAAKILVAFIAEHASITRTLTTARVAGGVWGIAKLGAWLRSKLGEKAGKDAESNRGELSAQRSEALGNLRAVLPGLVESGNTDAATQIQAAISTLEGNQ